MITVYVPVSPFSAPSVDPGSAVVADTGPRDGLLAVYFEGNRFRMADLARWVDRVAVATDRLLQRYPSVARGSLPASDLVAVGSFDPELGAVTLADAEAQRLVGVWTGEWAFSPAPEQLLTTPALRRRAHEVELDRLAAHDPVTARRLRRFLR